MYPSHGGGQGKKLSMDTEGFLQNDASKYQLWYANPSGFANGYVLDGNV